MSTLYYVHDPMCSWCWGFSKTWSELQARLPDDVEVVRLLGGLAPDSDAPMPDQMRRYLQETWRRIQERIPGTQFNFDFWTVNTPRRSTYPACRAVIAARSLDASLDAPMTRAIQEAYYLNARNPSDDEVLIDLAVGLGLDGDAFSAALNAEQTQQALEEEMMRGRAMGLNSFPSLMFEKDGQRQPVQVVYDDAGFMLDTLERASLP